MYSASRSVIDDVRRSEELRLGAISIDRDSKGCINSPRLEMAPSSVARVRVIVPVRSDEIESVGDPSVFENVVVKSPKSGRSGMVSKGGTNVVDAEPDPDPELLILCTD